MEHIVMGVDIGGSHITAELIDLQKKQEIEETLVRTKLDSHAAAEDIIENWAKTIEQSMEGYPIKPKKISIAMPGPMDYKNGICKIKDQDKYPALYNKNIKEMLARRLNYDVSAVNFMNDAACFLKGELFIGSLSGFDEAIGLTLGTGLGTAHTTNGAAFDSDLWKMPFQKGIAEDYISTRWFVKRYFELSGIQIADIKDLVDHHQDSPHFKTVFAEFSENLAKFIHKFIRKKMPLAAVIGGNIVKAEAFFLEDTRRHLAKLMGYSFPLKRSELGEKAALLGAGTSF
ncbi:transcriptional regulator [Pedobacter yulinensis]|uniref:Transcriptional regulator n=1 Tax=Pedobacter yulinensis TaxID=2126353 RepID=A0A2T3HM73_9SPHI|nr:ROK family protein [Pedobacter yulinensis]PST83552.1 transcriptional regulator [Pedobacter yulinensis]